MRTETALRHVLAVKYLLIVISVFCLRGLNFSGTGDPSGFAQKAAEPLAAAQLFGSANFCQQHNGTRGYITGQNILMDGGLYPGAF
jgi:hypothetical protein